MIDFSKITKTVDGMDCRYIHERESNGERVHVFALFNEVGERYEYYNEQGKRMKWSGSKWELEQDGKWKIYEPKIVEVTQYVALLANSHGDYYTLSAKEKEQLAPYNCLSIEQKTFRFEVPNE